MTTRKADILLLFVAICWGCSYWSMKVCVGEMPGMTMIAMRFGIAFSVVALIFFRKLRDTNKQVVLKAAILGFVSFCIFITLLVGLKNTSASNAGFINATTIVMVPLIHAILTRKFPSFRIAISSILAFSGVALMTISDTLEFSSADAFVAVGAFFYAMYVIVTDSFSKKCDSLLLGVWQLGFTALYAFIYMLFFESPSLPQTGLGWISIFVMVLPCTAFGFVAQTFAQKFTPPEHASMLFALEPVSSAIFSFLILGEVLQIRAYVGAVIIFVAVLIAARETNNH